MILETIQIGDTLNIKATAAEAGAAGNELKVYVNGIEAKNGNLSNGADAKAAVTELIQVANSQGVFNAVKAANGGHVYDVNGDEIMAYSANVALYRLVAKAEDAVNASCNLNVVITEAMLEGQTNVTITIE